MFWSSGGTRNRSSNGRPRRRKGQLPAGKAVQYAIKSRRGKPTYFGTTNNPGRRAAQHRQSGRLGRMDTFEVQTRSISRKNAERVEAAKLSSHRREHGQNPKHNTTNDGKFHRRKPFFFF